MYCKWTSDEVISMLNEYYCKYNSEDENCSRKVKKKPPVYPFPLSGKLQKKYHIIHLCIYIYLYIAWKFETGWNCSTFIGSDFSVCFD